jgi:hypothetical protein
LAATPGSQSPFISWFFEVFAVSVVRLKRKRSRPGELRSIGGEMSDSQHLLERQAEWQKNRARLSWPEKIRMVEALQETLRRFRSLRAEQQQRSQKGQGG